MDKTEFDFTGDSFADITDNLQLGYVKIYAENDIAVAVNLRFRLLSFVENCDNLYDPKNIAIAKDFVKECEKFENTNVSLRPLFFFYGNMSKAYLHATDFKKAESYAVAYYRLCQSTNDTEGIMYALADIMDIQIVKGEFELAYYLCEEYLKLPTFNKEYFGVKSMLEETLSKQNIVINKKSIEKKGTHFLEKVKMPKLYDILIDDEKSLIESGIRAIMTSMRVSRKTVLGYKKLAEQRAS